MNKKSLPRKNQPPSDQPARLREEAEFRYNQITAGKTPPSLSVESARMLHELQVHQIELEMQNEELRRLQDEMEAGLGRYTELYDYAPVGYFTLDKEGLVQQVNLHGANLLQVERSRLVGRQFALFIEMDHREIFNELVQKLFVRNHGQNSQNCEVLLAHDTGSRIWVHINAAIKPDQQVCRMVVSDISERRNYEKAVQDALAEKEALLRELYHRTKNNMQVIRGMLAIHRNSLQDAKARQVFEEISGKIQGMALVHEMLYQSQNLSHINLKNYIQELVQILQQQASGFSNLVSFQFDLVTLLVPIEIAIPVGLIVNELISNSFKHAFPDHRAGILRLRTCIEADGRVLLEVSDNGVGVLPGYNFRESASLGIRTIFALSEMQLQGQVNFFSPPGLICQVRFDASGKA
jgi:PAS domain S-box-containing protein